MRPNKITRFVSILILSSLSVTIAHGADPIVGYSNLEKRKAELKKQQKAIQDKIDASSDEDEISRLNTDLTPIDNELSDVSTRMRKGNNKVNAVIRKENRIRDLSEQNVGLLADIQAAKDAGDTDEAARLQGIYDGNLDTIERKKGKIAKKKEKFEKAVGEKMGGDAPIIPMPRPSLVMPVFKPTLTDRQKKEISGCWDLANPVTQDLFVYFPLGSRSVKTFGESDEFSAELKSQIRDLQRNLAYPDSGKINKVEITSYTSKVDFTKKGKDGKPLQTQAELSSDRSTSAERGLFSNLMLAGTSGYMIEDQTDDVYKKASVEAPPIGPGWKPGDYGNLAKKKIDLKRDGKLIEARARELVNDSESSADANPTPARVIVFTDEGKVDVEKSVTATMAALTKCCSKDRATLKYQPFQYSKITVSMPVFKPEAATCVAAEKVTTTNSSKPEVPVITSGTVGENKGSSGAINTDLTAKPGAGNKKALDAGKKD